MSQQQTTRVVRSVPSAIILTVVALVFLGSSCAFAANYVDDFNSDPAPPNGWPATSFSTGLTYTFTTDGEGGDFAWYAAGGYDHSGVVEAMSSVYAELTERITIVSNDAEEFILNSIYRDVVGDGITVSGTGLEPFTFTVDTDDWGTLSPSEGSRRVTKVELTSTDFYDYIDNVNVKTDLDPEIDVQHPAGTSIADGGTDNVGNRTVGTVNLTYTIYNSEGNTLLAVLDATASNYVNSSGFSVGTALPLYVAAGGTATLDVTFNVTAAGAFSFDMDIDSTDADEDPYDITVSGNGTPGVYGKGDVNGDGVIDLLDVRLCAQIAQGILTGTPAQRAAADVDDDGDVDETDAQILAEFIIGIRTTLP